jgi:hypothetical protein
MGSEHRLLQLVSWRSRWADADWCCKEQRRQSLWIVACPLALFSFITMLARPASRIHCHQHCARWRIDKHIQETVKDVRLCMCYSLGDASAKHVRSHEITGETQKKNK